MNSSDRNNGGKKRRADGAKRRPLFVSAHFDDVALSCGGLVAASAARGERPIVVTVFASAPRSSTVNPFIREMHREMGFAGRTARFVVAARRREDAAAVRALGAEHLWLRHCDAPYRTRRYTFSDSIEGPVHPSDRATATLLAADLLKTWRRCRGPVYLPLAVGLHVDHRLCFGAAAALEAAGARVRFYEDFPYVGYSPKLLDSRLATLSRGLTSSLIDVTPFFAARLAAIRCYASQLPTLFPGEDPCKRAAAYAATLARHSGRAAERVWQ